MNFKSLRIDKLGLSQEEMAEMLDVGIEEIKKWEIDNEPSLKVIQKIANSTGMDFNTICMYEKPRPKPLSVQNTWQNADFTKKTIVEYISDRLKAMSADGVTEEQRKKYIDELQTGINNRIVKPIISIVGRSDTGKSTLINALLGMDKMPTSWTPTTSIAVYIKHINDKPEFIKETAWVFADHVDGENVWDVRKLCDKKYCEKWKIAEGEVEILRDFGTRQGEMSQKNAGSAVIFLDSPILLDCDIVDLPGFGTEKESDDTITFKVAQKTDILIYLSQANGFMRIEDITYLKENVRNLPVFEKKGENKIEPLSNLFIIASQAHTVNGGNTKELNKILEKGYTHYCKTLAPEYWIKREATSGYSNYESKFLPKRFFTYTTDISELCNRFNTELTKILEVLPDIINEKAKTFVREYVRKRKPNLEAEIKKYERLACERAEYAKLLKQIKDNDGERRRNNDTRKEKIRKLINTLSEESKNEVIQYFAETINTDALVSMMKSKGIKNKKEDVECFASQLQDELQIKCNSILEDKSKRLSTETKQYVEQYNEDIKTIFDKFSMDVDFDAGFAFASSLAKIGIIGGLGAYIAAEAAFLLGSMTFVMGIGGDIAWAALGLGPIGIFVGLAIAGVLGFIKLFGGGWEKKVAEKIVKAYEEKDVEIKFIKGITDYWMQTEDAFDKAARNLDKEWDNYVQSLEDTVNKASIDEIEDDIKRLKNIMAFFDGIPL